MGLIDELPPEEARIVYTALQILAERYPWGELLVYPEGRDDALAVRWPDSDAYCQETIKRAIRNASSADVHDAITTMATAMQSRKETDD